VLQEMSPTLPIAFDDDLGAKSLDFIYTFYPPERHIPICSISSVDSITRYLEAVSLLTPNKPRCVPARMDGWQS
jgi:hypothetical protein